MNSATDNGTTEAIATHLSTLERSLLDPKNRADRGQVADLLSDDFLEFGSSGRVWTKATTIAGLAAENPNAPMTGIVTDLQVRLLAGEVALVTYVFSRQSPGEADAQTLRSSIWQCEGGKWRLVFHQGTRRQSEVER